ncbi:DEAD/DEAH box helicase [Woeseia oceani]|uniref:ATP-dependent RNA helicase DeaD n=1 Tax=Woeseia oceani TaxID=1548547 RepID=A0A193LHZ2_9GAMM|nr:DEAD/DEAH box helicase [Woeseia oceani]ANO52111.1 ATP-dependent RNA helicase [Woeseia oceani]
MSEANQTPVTFRDLKLPAAIQAALDDVGYEMPSPIQAEAIPHLLAGLDLLGHAPTGTGKTAAFALPLLSRIDPNSNSVQILTLTPTRELAIQVSEAFQRYAAHMGGFRVLPIYGGQEYSGQLRQLKRGVTVVVGTPGRVMDHMRKGTLKLDKLQALVLDEADEMLRMGFIDDVEWILEQTPTERQMALFSATMPREVERIARRHLRNPQEVSIKQRTATAETIRQRYWMVGGLHKLDALTRILEVEPFDAILMFVRTKTATSELAERLEARGYAAAAMNGDMAQNQREQMVERLKKGSLDILVATDVAARGLDVDRISHVINYDIPYDTEAYIHRIGRTGRAGRQGDAILFVAPRERRMLYAIEKATRQKIERLDLPTTETVNNKRIADFKQKISDTLATGELGFMQGLIEQYQQEHDVPARDIAAALAQISLGDRPLLMKPETDRPATRAHDPDKRSSRDKSKRSKPRGPLGKDRELFRIEVGYVHGVKPGNIVGAIANEAGLDGDNIGQIEIHDEHSILDLPVGMPADIFNDLKKARVCGQAIRITRVGEAAAKASGKPGKARHFDKKPRSHKPDSKGSGPDKKRTKPKPGSKPAGAAGSKPGKPGKFGKSAKPGKSGTFAKPGKPGKPAKSGKSGTLSKPAKPARGRGPADR